MKFKGVLVNTFVLVGVVAFLAINGCDTPKDPSGVTSSSSRNMTSIEDSVSYILGMSLSQQYSYFNEDDYRPEMVNKAMDDFLAGKEFRINEEEKKDILTEYFRWARAYKDDSLMRESTRWLASNAKKDGVVVTDRGLQYKVLKSGGETGVMPDGNDIVYIRYSQGSPEKGIVWDQSMATNKRDTISMPLNRELSGFSEACQYMREGDKIHAWLPPRIGSAEGRDPASVAVKNEVIFMEIELLRVKKRNLSNIQPGELTTYPGFFLDESKRNL